MRPDRVLPPRVAVGQRDAVRAFAARRRRHHPPVGHRHGNRADLVGCLQIGHIFDRDHDGQVEALLAGRRDDRHRLRAAEVERDLARRSHGRGQPDALCCPARCGPGGLASRRVVGAATQCIQSFERQGQVRAALAPGQRVHLVDDHGLNAPQGFPGLGRQHQEQRLGGGDEDVRRLARQLAALVGGGIAGADRDRYVRLGPVQAAGGVGDAGQRRPQVALDIDGQRLQRRDVEHAAAAAGVPWRRLAGQLVDSPQERGQRLPRASRRDDQGVTAAGDRLPGLSLRGSRLGEGRVEPRSGGLAEASEAGVGSCGHDSILPGRTDSPGLRSARTPGRLA